jgi:outer membrane lipoprotein LolB
MTRGAGAAIAAVALLALSACASQKGVDLPDISRWESREAILGQLDQWQFNGRIAVKTDDEGFNGKLRWVQNGDMFSATVSGPLGIGTVRIQGDSDGIEITDKNGAVTVLRDVETELYYRYGWTIPVESLRYWVLGIPDPRVPADTEFDEIDQLKRLEQRGWGVDFDRYREAGGQQMPARINAASSETTVRLVIDKWVFLELVSEH